MCPPQVTQDVCYLARWIASDLYLREVDSLRFELSMGSCSQEMAKVVADIIAKGNDYLKNPKFPELCWNFLTLGIPSDKEEEARLGVSRMAQMDGYANMSGHVPAVLPAKLPAGADKSALSSLETTQDEPQIFELPVEAYQVKTTERSIVSLLFLPSPLMSG